MRWRTALRVLGGLALAAAEPALTLIVAIGLVLLVRPGSCGFALVLVLAAAALVFGLVGIAGHRLLGEPGGILVALLGLLPLIVFEIAVAAGRCEANS